MGDEEEESSKVMAKAVMSLYNGAKTKVKVG